MANQKLTDKTALNEQAGSGDLLMLVDVNDTTGSSAGTSKKEDIKYFMQTDKIPVSNAEFQDLGTTPKTLVGALSGYMINVFRVTILCTHASPDDSAAATLRFTYDTSESSNFWTEYRRFMNGVSTDASFCFSPNQSSVGSCKTTLLNKHFSMLSSADYNGGLSADFYVPSVKPKV